MKDELYQSHLKAQLEKIARARQAALKAKHADETTRAENEPERLEGRTKEENE